MIVVSDTSPLTGLLIVGEADLLVRLFVQVIIPAAVEAELRRTHPTLPDWLRVQALRDGAKAAIYAQTVDRGEAQAIALAEELHADHLLIDGLTSGKVVVWRSSKVCRSWDCWAWSCSPNARGSFLPRGVCSIDWTKRPASI